MKKRQTLTCLIWAIMKFSGLQLLLIAFLSSAVIASPVATYSQNVLEEIVSLNADNEKIKRVLSDIEKSVKVKFTYNPQSISLDQKVSFEYKEQRLADVLEGIFNPLQIQYQLSGDYIILRKRMTEITSSNSQQPNLDVPIVFEVSGTIKDPEGVPLPGVNILVKGSSIGTTSDTNGNYKISVPDGTEILVFSFIGYKTQEVLIDQKSVIDIVLETDVSSLDEVVVIGYGTAEKKEITSAVASVESDAFNKGNVYDAAQFLQGKVAGLSIVKPGSDPNAGYNIRLRGLSTFGANSSPLIIIDGVLGGSLQSVDPNEIESMDVLKDGSAAAIYGTRGSSGVIIVTTKKGKRDVSGIDYDTYWSFEKMGKTVEVASAERFVEEGGPDNGSDTNWIDEVTRTGVSQAHNLAFYGGSSLSSYRMSVNYRDVEGVQIGSGFNQLNTRLNLNHSAFDGKLNLTGIIGVTLRNATFRPYETMRFALVSNPTSPIYIDNNPSLGYLEPNTTEFHNPVAIMNETTDDGEFKTMLTSLNAEYEILDGLKISGFYSLQYESDLRSAYFSSKMRFAGSSGLGGRATQFTEDRESQLLEFTGYYKRTFDKMTLNFVAGYSYQKFVVQNFNAFNTGFITDELLYNNLGLGLGLNSDNASLRGFGSSKGETLLASFFGRAMLNYDDTYFLTASYRKEGSSRFGPNERWGDFYSISGGVDISRLFTSPFQMLKLRAGYGLTGNLPVPFYSYMTRLNGTGVTTFDDGTSERLIRLFNYVSNENPDLKWEEKGEFNFGLDFAVLDSRLSGSIDYYIRKSENILFNQPVSQPPNFYGFTLMNLGEMESRGFEVLLNYNIINKNQFTYTTGITYSTNKTEVVTLNGESQVFVGGGLGPPGLNGIAPIKAEIGKELGLITAPIYTGLSESGVPETEQLEDINGDGAINNLDWPVVGNGLPDFEFAWNNSLVYRNFDLNFTLRGVFGHSLVNVNRAYYEVPQNSSNYNLVVTKYYNSERTGSEVYNSYYVEKADFFKLDNIQLGYNIHLNNSVFRKLRFYVSGQNLFVITDYTGVDPEVHYGAIDPALPGGINPLFPGIDDRTSYFRSKTYTVGLNVGF